MQPLKEYSLRSEDWPLALLMKGPAVLSKLRRGDPPADKPVAAILAEQSEQEAGEAAAYWEQHELGKNGASLACVGDTLLTLERAAPRQVADRHSKKIGLKPVGHRPRKVEVEKVLPEAPAIVADNLDNDADMDNEETAAKRLAGSPGSAERPKKKVAAGPSPHKLSFGDQFDEIDCGAEGACGFNCLAVGSALCRGAVLEKVLPKAKSMGITLRTEVAQHLNKHAADYRPFWQVDDKTNETMEGGPVASDWSSWVASVKRPSRWICGLTLKAASRRLGLKIIVVQRVGGSWNLLARLGLLLGAPLLLCWGSPVCQALSITLCCGLRLKVAFRLLGLRPCKLKSSFWLLSLFCAALAFLMVPVGCRLAPLASPRLESGCLAILFGLRTCVLRLLRLLLVRALLGLIVRFGLALGVPLRFLLVRVLCCALGVAIIWKGIIKSGSLGWMGCC